MQSTSDPARLEILYFQYSALDMEKIRYTKRAEEFCRQTKNSTYEWSPALAKMGKEG